jgi:hypothetical protein
LSPVGSDGELLDIGEAAKGCNAWVGIMKSAEDIADAGTAPAASWTNLDGSEVPDSAGLWADGEPNNNPGFQTRAHWYGTNAGGKRRDLNPVKGKGPDVTGAVYKCCALNVNTCYNFPDEEEDAFDDQDPER